MELSLKGIFDGGDGEAWMTFADIRWPEGPVCPRCSCKTGGFIETRGLFRCESCRYQFNVLSGSAFHSNKLGNVTLLAAVFLFVTNAKGISSIQLANTVGISQKTAWVLMHKFREIMSQEIASLNLSGIVEIDGATFGGHRRLESQVRPGYVSRFYQINRNHKRIVVVAREHGGRTVPIVGLRESDAVPRLMEIITPGSVVVADGAHAWDGMREAYDLLRVSHKFTFSENGASTNMAESFWSMLRRTHKGVHHRWSGQHAQRYVDEVAWRQDHRALSPSAKTQRLLGQMLSGSATTMKGYWQRSSQNSEVNVNG